MCGCAKRAALCCAAARAELNHPLSPTARTPPTPADPHRPPHAHKTPDAPPQQVCELDIMADPDAVHYILDEMLLVGCIVDTNKGSALEVVQLLDQAAA